MQTYHVKLQSEIFKTFRCQRAANSLDIDVDKKSLHELSVSVDIEKEFNIGVIVGASGSGKTTLAHQIFGNDCFKLHLDSDKSIIDQLPESFSYDECAGILAGIGLTSVPCWIRPVKTLSNGQKARAEAALAMTKSKELTVIDEWTSVVDRTVAKVMSHCVQKFARNQKKRIVLLSCHYDVLEWLDPDWVIDCNKQQYIDRRLLPADERKRKEHLSFEIRSIDSSTWKYFSKYHYLSSTLAAGKRILYGLFKESDQIGFIAYNNYVPHRTGTRMIMHANRIVIHPDYAGLGLGIKLLDKTAEIVKLNGFSVMIKMSSIPMFKHLNRSNNWQCIDQTRQIGKVKSTIRQTSNDGGFRVNIKTWTFKLIN